MAKSLKGKKSTSAKWFIIALCVLLLAAAGVGGYFIYAAVQDKGDDTNYAEDIFYQAFLDGKIERIKFSDLRSEDFAYSDYFVYMYDFSENEVILNMDEETCSTDDACSELTEQNEAVLDLLLDAREAGKKVFIMDAEDLEENSSGIHNFTTELPFIIKIENYDTIAWNYAIGESMTVRQLTLLIME